MSPASIHFSQFFALQSTSNNILTRGYGFDISLLKFKSNSCNLKQSMTLAGLAWLAKFQQLKLKLLSRRLGKCLILENNILFCIFNFYLFFEFIYPQKYV